MESDYKSKSDESSKDSDSYLGKLKKFQYKQKKTNPKKPNQGKQTDKSSQKESKCFSQLPGIKGTKNCRDRQLSNDKGMASFFVSLANSCTHSLCCVTGKPGSGNEGIEDVSSSSFLSVTQAKTSSLSVSPKHLKSQYEKKETRSKQENKEYQTKKSSKIENKSIKQSAVSSHKNVSNASIKGTKNCSQSYLSNAEGNTNFHSLFPRSFIYACTQSLFCLTGESGSKHEDIVVVFRNNDLASGDDSPSSRSPVKPTKSHVPSVSPTGSKMLSDAHLQTPELAQTKTSDQTGNQEKSTLQDLSSL